MRMGSLVAAAMVASAGVRTSASVRYPAIPTVSLDMDAEGKRKYRLAEEKRRRKMARNRGLLK